MIIVNLKGGLGNQMFQYALGWVLAKKKRTYVKVDLRYYEEFRKKAMPGYVIRGCDLDLFGIKLGKLNKVELALVKMLPKEYHIREFRCKQLDLENKAALYERSRKFEERVFNTSARNIYLDGYWQSPKYFEEYRDDIINLFNFDKVKNLASNTKFIESINYQPSICINVRRSDFVNNPEHDCVDKNFYLRAIQSLESQSNVKHKIYIFSDDLEWCKNNLIELGDTVIVDHALAGDRFINYLYLMTKFDKFIIPNSTFAWWAAWLSKLENKTIIAPKKWSGLTPDEEIDIIPLDWIKL